MFIWNPRFTESHACMQLLNSAEFKLFSYVDWPTLSDFNLWLSTKNISSLGGANIRFVEQEDSRSTLFSRQYEPRIFLTGEVQTRTRNWHDFFQVLVWNLFPKTKALLNARHYFCAAQRFENHQPHHARSSIENAITLFDEGGAVVVSDDMELLEAIRHFEWKKVFWQHRSRCENNLRIFGFGHALYEKMLNPYIGLTAHSVLLRAPAGFFESSGSAQRQYVDSTLSAIFQPTGKIRTPADLQPLPILGYPGWWIDDQNEAFYENSRYFRPGRRTS